jgi:ATP-dependent protease HslVU (ClpYQ) ATPase subunit
MTTDPKVRAQALVRLAAQATTPGEKAAASQALAKHMAEHNLLDECTRCRELEKALEKAILIIDEMEKIKPSPLVHTVTRRKVRIDLLTIISILYLLYWLTT